MESGRRAVRYSPSLYRRGSHALGVRSRNLENAEVRSRRALSLLVGRVGRLPRRLLGSARLQRGPGRQLLYCRSRYGTSSKVPAAPRRESNFSRRETRLFGLEVRTVLKAHYWLVLAPLCLCVFVAHRGLAQTAPAQRP